jgi:two-component system OmpR family response regulator
VLVVDDEVWLAEAIALSLEDEGWSVRTVHRGRDVVSVVQEFLPDVIVLDIMLPDIDGFEVVSRLRGARNEVRVLFLTAKDSDSDRVAGLKLGGDDYLTKPFGIDELLVRAQILGRSSPRLSAMGQASRLVVADLELDEESREVTRGGARIDLTPTEFQLLRYLMTNARRVLTRDQILTHVWGMDFGASSNLVDMYVSYLRKKIDKGREPLIITVRATGFVLKPPA